jgi:ketosteroid isomerase-like protein
MSHENVETVRLAIEAFNERDLDRLFEHVGPDIEVDWSRSIGLEAGVYRGYEAVRRFWTAFLDAFQQITITPDELIDSGEDVVVPNYGRVVGRDGIEAGAQSVAVATLHDGLIVRWCLYDDIAQALAAAGAHRGDDEPTRASD